MVIVMLEKYLDFNETILKEYLKKYEYHWELLKDLNDIILEIGSNLDLNNYNKIEDNIWIHKSANVNKFAEITGPCIIDEGAEIRFNAYIRENVIIGKLIPAGTGMSMYKDINITMQGEEVPNEDIK